MGVAFGLKAQGLKISRGVAPRSSVTVNFLYANHQPPSCFASAKDDAATDHANASAPYVLLGSDNMPGVSETLGVLVTRSRTVRECFIA